MDPYIDWNNSDIALDGVDDSPLELTAGLAYVRPDGGAETAPEWALRDDIAFNTQEQFSHADLRLLAFDEPSMNSDPEALMQIRWEIPESPCLNCALGSYSCKQIREGLHQGFCTSCVALGLTCSFADPVVDGFNPDLSGLSWSALGSNDNFATSLEDLVECVELPANASLSDSSLQNRRLPPTNEFADGKEEPVRGSTPKVGARFSRESVRILKNWLTTHNRHPYPSDEEKEMLQRQTGLNRTQIANWLANARRRGKALPQRATSPQDRGLLGSFASVDIPQRRGTPALEAMNPLQRWQHSPPEHEPASVTAIARAVTASGSVAISSGLNSPFSYHYTDDSSNKSLCNQSSASSAGTSRSSNGSLASALSHGTHTSWGSLGSNIFSNRGRRRRRRRAIGNKDTMTSASNLTAQPKTFQCTFCTETFRTKHDWQRHEKSLHLSLERWVCAPEGPRAVKPDGGSECCVFCGEKNPSDAHIESHNHTACQERSLSQRTFYRKDHLNQHLRLVHNVKFRDWSMNRWKVATPEIRSRCGFCGLILDTWTIRTDHLAEHFKAGYSMADWKGDWGFEKPVLEMVENSMPPYLIHHERLSPNPYSGDTPPPASPRNAYELIKLELAYFDANHWDLHGRAPSDEDMKLEGCRIIFASELLSLRGIATQASWLRDLIMSNIDIAQKARFGTLRGAAENRLQILKINGKDNLFEACPMETQLHEFVKAKRLLGLTTMDDELQEEACRIVGRVEEVGNYPSEVVANWLLRIIRSSTDWLPPFRKRAHLPRSEDVQQRAIRSSDPTSIDSTIHNYSRLESELAEFLKQQRLAGVEPADEDLQREARMIIYEFDDGWNQTVADNHDWLTAFRERNEPATGTQTQAESSTSCSSRSISGQEISACPYFRKHIKERSTARGARSERPVSGKNAEAHARGMPCFLSDANCYLRLAKELRRWVVSTMSPNNPNQHVPTDEEMQYQARWMIYDDDDPWNQTAADNVEWLRRFKRDVGILKEEGPGLPDIDAWATEQGGTGFAPPYVFPRGHLEALGRLGPAPAQSDARHSLTGPAENKSYLETLASFASCQPAAIFCSRELEWGLEEFVGQFTSQNGYFPSDDALQHRAREILNTGTTAADDAVLLKRFKEWVQQKDAGGASLALPSAVDGPGAGGLPEPQGGLEKTPSTSMTGGVDLQISDEAIGEILAGIDYSFAMDDFGTCMEGIEHDGGVSLA